METTLRARHDLHLIRKAWHMATGCIGLGLFFVSGIEQYVMGAALLALALAGFALEMARLRIPSLNQRVLKSMGPLMRSSEQNSCSGLPFYALGVGASLLLFEREAALLSIMFLVFADPISSLFGIMFGQNKLISGKSLEGSMAGFVTCYLITFMWINLTSSVTGSHVVLFCILAGLIGAISELTSVLADDNLTIPLISGAGLSVINLFIPLL